MTIGHRVPYVSPAEFTSYPSYLDLDDLVLAGDAARQSGELNNLLLQASEQIDSLCNQPIGASTHTVTREARVRPDYTVRIKVPRRPYVEGSLSAVTWRLAGSSSSQAITNLTGADFGSGLLTIPVNASPGTRMKVTFSYVSGYPVAALTSAVVLNATSLAVSDPTGITPGSVLCINDPGAEEYVTVASSYEAGSATVPVTLPLRVHAIGVQLDCIPRDLKQACIFWTMGLLSRPASGGSDDAFSDAAESPTSTTMAGSRRTGRGFMKQARDIVKQGGYAQVMP